MHSVRKCTFLWIIFMSYYNVACEDFCNKERIEIIECSESCYDVVKPFLKHFMEVKNVADKTIECQNEIKIKHEIIKSKDATIREKTERINEQKEIIDKQSDQIEALITKISNEVRNLESFYNIKKLMDEKVKQIHEYEKKLETMEKVIQENKKGIKIQNELLDIKDKQILKTEEQIRIKDEEIQKLQKNIKETVEKLKRKDEEVREKNNQAERKDHQIIDLTNQFNTISKNLTKTIKDLSKCDEMNFCPYVGNGIFHIKLPEVEAFKAPCNASRWMIIQRRIDGSVNFNRTWNEYKEGFGNINGEFFIGLEKLHLITQSRPHELKILMGDLDGDTAFAQYDEFKIGNEKNFYALEILGNFSGNAGDSLDFNKNMNFSTFDNDNDMTVEVNCGRAYAAGWWFNQCSGSSLNGVFNRDGQTKFGLRGVLWYTWKPPNISLKFVQMMIRPKENVF